ncbi:dihydroorotase [Lacrimispora sp. 210928-DFI.3.58]|uniref:dihydroorotase n=1 Tax=Lacrimispora sp. 210928-DFI.3.58 TaxID=2883214 RepID=UPI001D084C70|nr:amidohydrolase family protein [Lacrimispora sp. 210928-DFI.3.58]MCB7318251.1 amidohydrolase family protein [Lacrimispora sp. 210928-DFI.3.58]
MVKFDVAFQGARVLGPEGLQFCTIGVNQGKICSLIPPEVPVEAKEMWDFSGKVILPGAIDTHGHINNKEPFDYGTAMAARGGFTTVIEMPMSKFMPNNDNTVMFEQRKRLIEEQAYIDIALWGAAYPSNLDLLEDMIKSGSAGFKIFTCPAGKTYPYFDDYHLLKLMERTSKQNTIIGIHAENSSICDNLTEEFVSRGAGKEYFEESRPIVAEAMEVAKVCVMAALTGSKIHICHVTCPEAMEIIEIARRNGTDVSAETCAQYLSLTKDDIVKYGAYAKCGPPLRAEDKRDELWRYVLNKSVDTIGTDSTVYTEADKEGDFWKASSGFPGMDIAIPTLIDEGIHKRGMTWERLAELIATNAAKRFGLKEKGKIAPGYDADVIVVDPDKKWIFRAKETFWKNKSDKFAYEGKCYKGKIEATFVRGQAVYVNGQLVGKKGFGKFIWPDKEAEIDN